MPAAPVDRLEKSGIGNRVIVHERIADQFLDRFEKKLENLVPGDPMDPKTTLGPLCTKGALELVEKQIQAAVDGGAKVLLGGKRLGIGEFVNKKLIRVAA